MIAAALGAVASVKRLLARGAQVNLRDEQGQTSLHAACQFAFQSADPGAARALIEALLEAGAELDAVSRAGQTPLLLLLGARAAAGSPSPQRGLTELTELMLARGADPDAQDQRGVGVLHAAAMHGLTDPCRSLLRAGADPALRDTLGRSAAEVALMLGYADLAAEIKRAAGARQRAQGLQTR
jgi:ankyrin repeat protein